MKRWGNFIIQASTNCLVIINNYNVPLGSRLFGPIFLELKSMNNYTKVINLAEILL